MKSLARNLIDWVESRTGVEGAVRNFLFEEIPSSAGWAQVFGSVALFLFLNQIFTGILLAFNYAPTPGDAYNSVTYIVREVTGGKMIRGLHHWGSSIMIVVVVLHMIQVFIYGAYKKPREVTWMAGCILLLLTLGFGLTGYLLPWDNRAYWGTMVTTRIAQQAPVLGDYLLRLIGSYNGIGVVTFSRFYALHTLVLPLTMILMVGLHLYLVRRHGVTPTVSSTGISRPQRFYPRQAFRDVVAVFAAFAILFTMAAIVDVPLERLADPTDTSYVPRPDWYFLFLFQTLKFFQGSLEPVGSIVLPTVAVLFLFAVPFLDRGQVRKISQRTAAIGLVILACAGWVALTAAAIASTPHTNTGSSATAELQTWSHFSPQELAGIRFFRQEQCGKCHNLATGEPKPGPNLAGLETHKSTEWIFDHFKTESHSAAAQGSGGLSSPQWIALSALVGKLSPERAVNLELTPDRLTRGAELYVANGCGNCHKVNGAGGQLGPPLNGLAGRRSKEWTEKHFVSPRALSPGSIMPPYKFAQPDQDALIAYLYSLPP